MTNAFGMLFNVPSTAVHGGQEYESLTYDSFLTRCQDVVSRNGVTDLAVQLYAVIDRLKKQAIENERRVVDLENDVRELLASKATTERQMESNESGMSDGRSAPGMTSSNDDHGIHLLTSNTSRCMAVKHPDKMRGHTLSIFRVSDDWLQYLSTFLDVRSIDCLDITVCYQQDRSTWLRCLCTMDTTVVDKYEHSSFSLRWVLLRGVCVTSIKIRESSSKSIDSATFEGFSVPSLLSIDLKGCINLTDTVVSSFLIRCTHLQNIDFGSCTEISDNGVSALVRHCPQLSSINLTNCEKLTDVSVLNLADHCPQLRSITLTECSIVRDDSILSLARECRELRSIALSNRNITDRTITALAMYRPELTSINFTGCSYIRDRGVLDLVKTCPLLESINLYQCQITDKFFSVLVEKCPQLRMLNIAHTYISDDILIALGEHCHLLSSIKLNWCCNISDHGVIGLLDGYHQLNSINLGGCKISDDCVWSISYNCPQLVSIDLSNCKKITDAGILALAQGCPQLTSINLNECVRITNVSLLHLERGCPLLSSIEFGGCESVTYAGVSALMKACPLLTFEFFFNQWHARSLKSDNPNSNLLH